MGIKQSIRKSVLKFVTAVEFLILILCYSAGYTLYLLSTFITTRIEKRERLLKSFIKYGQKAKGDERV